MKMTNMTKEGREWGSHPDERAEITGDRGEGGSGTIGQRVYRLNGLLSHIAKGLR